MAIVNFQTFLNERAAEEGRSVEDAETAARARCDQEGGTNFTVDPNYHGYVTLFTWHTHVGLCVAEREHNGYDDSDFYMTVYRPETDDFTSIMFATTRGWSYPAMASFVDATPEVKARYAAHLAAIEQAAQARYEIERLMEPMPGKTVEVIKGRKVPVGTTGIVFWVGAGIKYTPNYGYSKHQVVPNRIGLRDAAGQVHWTSAANVQVI